MSKPIISVIGDRNIPEGSEKWNLAVSLGRRLIDDGYRILSGGIGSLPRALSVGGRKSSNYTDGDIIAILPGFDPKVAEGVADIVIASGLDEFRNLIVANGNAVVAMGGGAGTLSELAFAWSLKRLVICYRVKGWSSDLAGKRLDARIRYANIPDDKLYPAENETDVSEILKSKLELYNRRHTSIR
ncbi:MAG: acyl-CoA synthetase [Candidatus Thermoplasmatota archaeon]|jgi:uncharacterized protein (TIGR00725 family)|nr:acyl-CoA synthetase [Candidatus Thermoplasmatota archaeon]MCL6002290.1 acyl-CoA synthetase [Candidatus Thermoplasmatota archaeon]